VRYRAIASAVVAAVVAASVGMFCPPQDGRAAGPPGAAAHLGVWLDHARIRSLPASGPAWDAMKTAADGALGRADVWNLDSNHDVRTLAVALVYARTGQQTYRQKAVSALRAAMKADATSPDAAYGSLARSRNVVSYVISADLIDLGSLDPALEQRFRAWLAALPTRSFRDGTMVQNHEKDANNHGTMAGAGRAAIAAYLGDDTTLARIAVVLRGWMGDRSAYTGFKYQRDTSWQADPSAPVGINPAGATSAGHSIDGALPEEMRRGCPIRFPPCYTHYPWEGLAGAIVQAQILAMHGYDPWIWSNRAFLRAVRFLYGLAAQDSAWALAPKDDDAWVVHAVNFAHGTDFPTTGPAAPAKNMAWTSWTLQPTASAPAGADPTVDPPPAASPGETLAPGSPRTPPATGSQGAPAQLAESGVAQSSPAPAVQATALRPAHLDGPHKPLAAAVTSRHRISLAEARRTGVPVGVILTTWPGASPRVVRVRLFALRHGGRSHVITLSRGIRRPGASRVILTSLALRRSLRTGRYEIEVRAGTSPRSLQAPITRHLIID
jgi:alginate lyase